MAPKSITLEDIASHAGVSTAAVSQALSGKGALSPATRQRILQVVEELSYRPDRTAQSLALRRASQASGKRIEGSLRSHLPPPGVMVFYDLPELVEITHLEIQQMEEEGHEVGEYREQLAAWSKPTKQRLYRLYSDVLSAPMRADWSHHEPDTLAEIQRARPAGPRDAGLSIPYTALYERIYGAWLGRVTGCTLGKPLQAGWSKAQVVQYLQVAGSYPLTTYIPRLIPLPSGFEFNPQAAGCFLGEIEGAPPDDDTDYTVLNLHLLESYGLHFATSDLATEWLGHLAYFGLHTTERAIYRNLVWNVHPDEAATFVNPEREFIGARVRADIYGYVTPAKPELAAALAFRDASLSHTKNGIYSAMLTAAMLSWAFVTDDPVEIVSVGLSEIPQECRLAEAVRDLLAMHERTEDWELAYEHLLLKVGGYSPIHTINNTAWVILSLLFGAGDFDRSLGLAVTCGMDTGSNAASLGSLLGLCLGASRLPSKWVEPLQDVLHTAVAQIPQARISVLARRTAQVAEATLSAASQDKE